MMEKTRTLFNVVLFVLVLFGSVVPALAQGVQGYEGVINTAVVAGGTVFGVVITLLAFWWAFDRKVDKLGTKIDNTNDRLGTKIDTKIDAAKKELKDDAQAAHTAIGTNLDKVHADIRDSEKRLDANINKVHATVQLLLEQAIRGRPSESAQDRP